MNTGFIILTNELNDLASCQIGFSGEYRFDGYTVCQNTEKDPENGGQNTLTLDLSAYVKEGSELREIYPLKDKSTTAVLNNGIFKFESNKNIAARVFEID